MLREVKGRNQNYSRFSLAIIISLFLLFCLLNINPLLRTAGGAAYSIILAESIIENFSYNDIHLTDSPPHTKFPPFFPLILTPVILFAGRNIVLLKIINICFGIGAILFLYYISLLFFEREKSMFVALLFSLSPLMIYYSLTLLSEVPHIFFSLCALYFVQRYKDDKKIYSKNGSIGAIFLILSFYTRSVGLALIIASLGFLLFENGKDIISVRVKKFWFIFCFSLIPSLFWFLGSFLLTGTAGEYVNHIFLKNPENVFSGYVNSMGFLKRIFFYIPQIFKYLASLLSSGESHILILGAFFFFISLFAFLRRLFLERSIIEYYFIFYLLIILVWPWHLFRLFFPLLALSIFYFVDGTGSILQIVPLILRNKKRLFLTALIFTFLFILLLFNTSSQVFLFRFSKRYSIILLSFFLFVVFIYFLLFSQFIRNRIERFLNQRSQIIKTSIYALMFLSFLVIDVIPPFGEQYSDAIKNYKESAIWIKENTGEHSLIMTYLPQIFYLWSNRKVVHRYPFTGEDSLILYSIMSQKVDYVVCSEEFKDDKEFFIPVLEKNKYFFRNIKSIGETNIFKTHFKKTPDE